MDQRLYDAARTGDVDALYALRIADPFILNKVCLAPFAETPLHVAALAGQTEFAKEIVRLMPSFARELNRDGLAPMHVASARGDEDLLMELLKLDEDRSLCIQRDNINGQIPLHYAVVRGRIPVIEKLVSHCCESLQEDTALGETVLHLAVKNSQLGALKVVLEKLKGLECFEELLKIKDNQGKGKTIFELAETKKQVQVLQLLKEYQNAHIDNDASAKSSGNDEITERPPDKQADQHQIEILPSDTEADGKQNEKQESEKESTPPSRFEEDNILLVAAALVATVTYQALVTPPSSIWEKGINLNARCITKISNEKSFQERKQHCPALMFYLFMILNTACFLSSAFLILVVTVRYGSVRSRQLCLSIVMLLLNYGVLIAGQSPDVSTLYIFLAPLVLIVGVSYAIILRKDIAKFRQTSLKFRANSSSSIRRRD